MWRKSKVLGLVTIVLLIALGAAAFALLARPAGAAPSVAGTVVATAVDQDGLPVRGNCFRLQGVGFNQQLCDALDGTVDGIATFTGVPFGAYTLSQSYTPVGFAPPSPNGTAVNVPDGTPVGATLTSSRTDLQVTLRDDANQLVLGACFNVASGAYTRTICDGRGGSAIDGVTLIDYVPGGDVVLTQTSGPATHDLMTATTVTVTRGVLNSTDQATMRRATVAFTVSSVDQDGQPVRGACWALAGAGSLCDALDGNVDGAATYPAVPAGAMLSLRQNYTPIGFAAPSGPVSVTPSVGGPNGYVFTSQRTDLEVTLLDQNEQPVLGACFSVAGGNYARGPLCDASGASGGTNGVTLIDYVPGGTITLTQNRGPEGATLLEPQSVAITPGVRNTITLHTAAPVAVSVTLASVDQDGGPVRGACFSLTRGSFAAFRCDSQDGAVDGQTTFAGVPSLAGFTAGQTYTPIGFAAPADNPVTVDVTEAGPNGHAFTSNRTDLEITLVDLDGNPVLGACFNVTTGNYRRTLCDGSARSGGLNGVTLIDYSPAPSTTVTLTNTVPGPDQPAPVTYTDLVAGALNRRVVVTSGNARLTLAIDATDANWVIITAADQGDTVWVERIVRNTSVNPARGVRVTGAVGGTCGPFDLAPNDGAPGGRDEWACQTRYTISADDRRAGALVVNATATADNGAEVTATASLPVRQASATVTLQVFEDPERQIPATGGPYAPETVFYGTVTVINTGQSVLSNIVLIDQYGYQVGYVWRLRAGGSATVNLAQPFYLYPDMGATAWTFRTSVTADQLDAAVAAPGVIVQLNPWNVAVTLALYWDAGRTQPVTGSLDEGDTVYIEATATNTGSVTLLYPYIQLQWSLGHSWYTGYCYLPYELHAGESASCLTGQTATVEATDRVSGSFGIDSQLVGSFPYYHSFGVTSFPVNQPAATLTITAADGAGNPVAEGSVVNPGTVLTVTYTVTDQGLGRLDNVAVTGDGLPTDGCAVGTLAAGASGTCSGIYTVEDRDGLFTLTGAATAQQLTAPAAAQFGLIANRRPIFATNPVKILATRIWGDFPGSLLALSGASDPEGTPLHIEAGTYGGTEYSYNTVTVNAEGFGYFDLNTNFDTTFHLTVYDADGRSAVLTLVVDADTIPPVVTTSGDQTLEATSPAGATVFFTATATDDRTATPGIGCVVFGTDFWFGVESGSMLPIGSWAVTCMAWDDANNTGSSLFNVTVHDTTLPVVTTSGDLVVEATGPGEAPVAFTATATDAVAGSPAATCLIDETTPITSGDVVAIGHHDVRCASTDGYGNTGSASFTVDVVDTTPPAFTVTPDQAVVLPGAPITFTVTISDAVTPDPSLLCQADGTAYPPFDPRGGTTILDPGTYAFTCTAGDNALNQANGSAGTVRVDAPPVANGDWSAIVVRTTSGPLPDSLLTIGMVDDPDGDPVSMVAGIYPGDGQPENTLTVDAAGYGSFDLATNVDTVFLVTATDGFGAQVTFAVTIDADTEAPAVTLTAPDSVEATGPEGAPILFTAMATDDRTEGLVAACTLDGAGPFASGDTAPVGVHTLACSATDLAGNTGAASVTIAVVEPATPVAQSGVNLAMANAVGGELARRWRTAAA